MISQSTFRVDKHFFMPVNIGAWVVVIFEQERYFTHHLATKMIEDLVSSCHDVGMHIFLVTMLFLLIQL